jgi:hypothetical protein
VINQEGAEEIEGVVGASPLVMRAGKSGAVWVWGNGFNVRSTLTLSEPSIRLIRNPEPVIEAQNMPGYDGFRTYLELPSNTPEGPVDVIIENPNGSSATGVGLFSVVPPLDTMTPEGEVPEDIPECTTDDSMLILGYIGELTPNLIAQGETVQVQLPGSGFSCSPRLVISGGGVAVTSPVYRTQDERDPTLSYLNFTLQVEPNAPLGMRTISVINSNGDTRDNRQAFTVISATPIGGAACQSGSPVSGRTAHPFALMITLLLSALALTRRALSRR